MEYFKISFKMKVIMLDIDGVLNVYPQGQDEFGDIFHAHFIENLKRLIDETGAKIVISSSWRMSGLSVMQDMWKKRNLPGEVIDVTCTSNTLVKKGKFTYLDDVDRGHEIQEWLDTHEGIEQYVILDDDRDFLPHQLNNFVRTANNNTHPDHVDIQGYGLTTICTEKAIEILNK